MAIIDSKSLIDNIIKNNGFYNGDDEEAPDNPRIVKIVEFINMKGKTAWWIISEREYLFGYSISPYVRNPQIIWEYKK